MAKPVKAQLLDLATNDATLLALLAGGSANSIYPRATVEPTARTAAPYIVLRVGSDVSVDTYLRRLTWTWYVYGEPYDSYWSIDKIIRRLRDLMEGATLSYEGDVWSEVELADVSDELADDEWGKRFKFARFQAHHI